MRIDKKLLDKQIKAVLNSDMPETMKAGLHNLLGELYDETDVYFPVLMLHKDDLLQEFRHNTKKEVEIRKKIRKLNPSQMITLARKLGDSLCDNCYWEVVRVVVEDRIDSL